MKNNLLQLKKMQNNCSTIKDQHYGLCRSLRKFLKEVILFENHINSIKKFKNNKKKLITTKIQIGAAPINLKVI